jgi:hypothetical protein
VNHGSNLSKEQYLPAQPVEKQACYCWLLTHKIRKEKQEAD